MAHTVTRKEFQHISKALAALVTEWDKLRSAKVWKECGVREWKDVKAEAQAEHRDIHVGSLHELLVEKGSELPEGDKNRKYKGRVVFLGDRVKDGEGTSHYLKKFPHPPRQ